MGRNPQHSLGCRTTGIVRPEIPEKIQSNSIRFGAAPDFLNEGDRKTNNNNNKKNDEDHFLGFHEII